MLPPYAYTLIHSQCTLAVSPAETAGSVNLTSPVTPVASVFFIPGNGKEDFINIFIESDEYYTGQTNILFNRYLFRDPTSEESVNYSLDYINSQDYKLLQRRILSTNEFIGL